ncbi:MAG: hypothetical protein NC078_12540 [Ruminococcus sp.]|nr:hypothetical protein [Ruminococcus sp.]
MSLQRYRIIYPDCLFRALKTCKNVEPPEDMWAEGAVCITEQGVKYIINRREGDGKYGFSEFQPDTLGMWSGFSDGNKTDIFEGDILKITCFVPAASEEEEEDDAKESGDPFSYFIPDTFNPAFPDEDSEEEPEEREVFAEPPEDAEETGTVEGVVYMSEGVFYLQYFDENSGCLSALPLSGYFFYDGLPAPGVAANVEGNLYDNEDLYKQVLHLDMLMQIGA